MARPILFCMTDFPHLTGSTSYPFNTPPQPYETYVNTFDYAAWTAGTRLTLCCVPWDEGGANVVEWADEATRDKWFEDLDSSAGECLRYTLAAPARIMDGVIKLPLPFDTGSVFNYAWVEMGTTPGEAQAANRVTKWGFFIDAAAYRSPAATELRLTVDWWTTFRARVNVASVRLERGHWAVANSATVTDFLADPLNHTMNLMDEEGDTLSTGTRWNLKTAESWQSGSQVAVFDVGAWNPDGDSDVATATTFPASPGFQTTGGMPSNTLISCALTDARTLVRDAPAPLLMAMRAAYITPERFLAFNEDTFTVAGVTCRRVESFTTTDTEITLSEADFNYPDTAKDLTKLYTSQYCRAHVLKEDGTAIDLPIEQITKDTGVHASLRIDQSAARILTYLSPIAGDTATAYHVARIDTAAVSARAGAWQGTQFNWTLPTYAVWLDAEKETAWTKKASRAQAKANAENTYEIEIDRANTAKRVADASAWTAWNVNKRGNDTTQTNTNESAATANANSRRSALAAYNNTSDEITANTLNADMTRTMNSINATNTNAGTRLAINEATHKTQHEQTLSLQYQADQLGIDLPTDSSGNITYDADGTLDITKIGSGLWTNIAQAQSAAQLAYMQTQISTDQQKQVLTLKQGTARFNTALGIATRTTSAIGSDAVSAVAGITGDTDAAGDGVSGNATIGAGIQNVSSILQNEVGIHSQDLQMDVLVNANGEQTSASMAHMFGGIPQATVNEMNTMPSIPQNPLTGVTANGYNLGNLNIAYAGTIYQNRKDRVYTVTTNRGNIQHSQAQASVNQTITDLTASNANTLTSVNAVNRAALVMGGTRQTITPGTQTVSMNLAYGSDSISQDMNTATAGTGQVMTGTAPRTRDTSYSNADATMSTTEANATRTRATQKANTYADATNSLDNAERQRITTVGGSYAYTVVSRDADNESLSGTAATATMTGTAPRTRDNALQNVDAGIQADDMTAPRMVTDASDPDLWAQRPASWTAYVETPCEADVTRIAERMNLYGYVCRRTISAPELNVMPEWSYWECAQAWVKPVSRGSAPTAAVNLIRSRLESGVTVWREPEMIGDVEQ